ncbi:MAG: CapA family protein [Clostridia bacterium]|nr:CapA family protein [Clostridia bacterium]
MRRISAALLLALLILLCSCAESAYNPISAPEEMSNDVLRENLSVSIPEPYPPDTRLSFAGCGDNIMYNGNMNDAKKLAVSGGRKYNFAPIYENIKPIIESADISFINQETPMAGSDFGYDDYPHFNSPRDLAYDIIEAGFDVVNLATNHMLDAGSSGLLETINFWNTLPVTTIGGYLDRADFDNIRIVECNDVKIAFLAFTYSTNGISLKSGYDIVIPYEDSEVIAEQVKKADKLADIVIVSMHWGNEYNFKPSDNQKNLAVMMAGLGVDVIIGHHPHVLQPVEWVDSPNGDGHKLLCAYSLGNLAAEQNNDYNYVGGILTFDIVREKGIVRIEDPVLIPTVYYFNRAFRQNSVHLMENFTEDMAKSHGLSYYGKTTSVNKLRSYVTNTVSKEFLPDFLK